MKADAGGYHGVNRLKMIKDIELLIQVAKIAGHYRRF